jgi:hypothetical protein
MLYIDLPPTGWEAAMHERRIARSYHTEMGLSFAVYAALLVGSIVYARPLPDSPLRTALLLAPMLGTGLVIWAIARHVARVDEYVRRWMLENFALVAAITAALTFTYGFLETAGFPRLSMFSVWMAMFGAWAAVCIGRAVLKR